MIEQVNPNVWYFTCDSCGNVLNLKEAPANWKYIKGQWERVYSTLDLCSDCARRRIESQPTPQKKPSKQKRIQLTKQITFILYKQYTNPYKPFYAFETSIEIANQIAIIYLRSKKV